MVSDSCMKWRFRSGTDCNREIFDLHQARAFAPDRRRCRGDYQKKGTEKWADLIFLMEGIIMGEKTEAQKKAQQKYMEKFAVARVRMNREKYEQIQAHAEAQGESVNSFINRAIDNQMQQDNEKAGE